MSGTKIYAGNFLVSFAILVAGSSASKVLQVMKHMGLACISLPTYFRHQQVSITKITEIHNIHEQKNDKIKQIVSLALFYYLSNILLSSIHLHWKEYQNKLINQAKQAGSLVLAGDGCHDSMGHCAKYCAYTIFSCTTSIIIHFSLVQVNKIY